MRAAVVLAIALAGLAMASPDSRNRVARALLEARAQPAADRQMWPELLGPERPEILSLTLAPMLRLRSGRKGCPTLTWQAGSILR
jgi:hypothetical protein